MKLENHFHDMQDMEFTIEEGKLYFLQTRNGKRTAPAAIQIACDLVDEGHPSLLCWAASLHSRKQTRHRHSS